MDERRKKSLNLFYKSPTAYKFLRLQKKLIYQRLRQFDDGLGSLNIYRVLMIYF